MAHPSMKSAPDLLATLPFKAIDPLCGAGTPDFRRR